MRIAGNGNSSWARVATWWISPVILASGLIGCSGAEAPTVAAQQPVRQAAPPKPTEDPVEPLSEACRSAVALAEKERLIRPGSIDRNGAVILTDARWTTRLDGELQRDLALCVSHFIAGGQNRWLTKVQFRNQTTGVIYATVEGKNFRVGE